MESTRPNQEVLLPVETEELAACPHHWVIERPSGPVSKGVCQRCGEERDFQNYIEGSWGNDISLESLSGGSRLPAGVDVEGAKDGPTYDEDE